ncbi:MAG: hypothetical protein DRQ55_07280 [Planctomycetota bacterium]|nr:MAG: hypothetical protein DRQ55_07280 [Planctomycetota bacterium]
MLCSALLPVLLCLPALGSDDLVPATIEAMLAAPPPLTFGFPVALEAQVLAQSPSGGTVRAAADLGDINADGVADVVTGSLPGEQPLAAWDGVTGELLWRHASPGGFRSPRCLAVLRDQLLTGESTPLGRVVCRRTSTGSPRWIRELSAHADTQLVNILSVRWLEDLNGDGQPDVAVAAGQGLDQALLLSGADGSTIWSHDAGDVVYDLLPTTDLNGDGAAELLAVGGDQTPFARALDGASGALLWDVPLDGPGAVAMLLDDVDGDGIRDLAVGQWNAPLACLLCLSGADGARLWQADDVCCNVTSLAGVGDLLNTGLHDIAVGSFDNAVNAVLALNGAVEWRREGSQTDGALSSMLHVVALGDLDQSGLPEVGAISLDHHFYLMGGELGQYMAKRDVRAPASVLVALPDRDGDGRPELAIGAQGGLTILDGNAGLADGPQLELTPPSTLAGGGEFVIWVYPATYYFIVGSLGIDELNLPGWNAPLLLDPASLFLVVQGPAPGAGSVGFEIPPLPWELGGVRLHLQAAQAFGPGDGWLSNRVSFTVPRR